MQTPISLSTLELGLTVDRLLTELEENFAPYTPQPSDSLNTIMYRSGQLSVVEWIRNRIEEE